LVQFQQQRRHESLTRRDKLKSRQLLRESNEIMHLKAEWNGRKTRKKDSSTSEKVQYMGRLPGQQSCRTSKSTTQAQNLLQ